MFRTAAFVMVFIVGCVSNASAKRDTSAYFSDDDFVYTLYLEKYADYSSDYNLQRVRITSVKDRKQVQEIDLTQERICNSDSSISIYFYHRPIVSWRGKGPDFHSTQFVVEDLNFDGRNDLRIQYEGEEYEDNYYYHCWIYDKKKGRLEPDLLFEKLLAPHFIPESRMIVQCLSSYDTSIITKWKLGPDGLENLSLDVLPGVPAAILDNTCLLFYSGLGWGCSESCSFPSTDGVHYVYDPGTNPDSLTRFEVRPLFEYDKIEVYGRYKLAYGSRNSETEGIGFYSSEKDTIGKQKWYSYTSSKKLVRQGSGSFSFVRLYPNEKNMDGYPKPRVKFKTAEKELMGHWGDMIPQDQEEKKEFMSYHGVHLYIYSLEFEIVIHSKGKVIRKFAIIPLLHGEC
jgi:hypothetical protein